MVGKNIWIDNHVLGGMINSELTDSVAFFCQLKCVKRHPVFLRNKTKKGKFQSPIVSISRETNISYGTIKKHFDILVNWGLVKVSDDKIIMSSSKATSLWAKENISVSENKKGRLGKKQYGLNCMHVSKNGDFKIVVGSVKVVNSIKVQQRILQKAETNYNIYNDDRKVLADANSKVSYCTLSNKSIAKKSNRKSASTGYRHKKECNRLSIYGSNRKSIVLKSRTTKDEWLYLKRSNPEHYRHSHFFNGTIYADVSSELFLIKKDSSTKEIVKSSAPKIKILPRIKSDSYGFVKKSDLLSRSGWSQEYLDACNLTGWGTKRLVIDNKKVIYIKMFTVDQIMFHEGTGYFKECLAKVVKS